MKMPIRLLSLVLALLLAFTGAAVAAEKQIGLNIMREIYDALEIKDASAHIVTDEDEMWFYHLDSIEGQQWYAVRSTGTDSHIMSVYEFTPLDQWGYPTGNAVNFRSEPYTISQDNIIRTLKRNELCHIIGKLINDNGEEWYIIEVNGTKGFLKKTVTRVLTQAETNALMGYTPTPAPPIPNAYPRK